MKMFTKTIVALSQYVRSPNCIKLSGLVPFTHGKWFPTWED